MSNIRPEDLATASESEFKSSTREELEAFAAMLQVEFHPNIKDDNLRARLMTKLGRQVNEFPSELPAQQAEDQAAEVSSGSVQELYALNLTPDGRWEGRRRIITITRPEGWKGRQPLPVRWGRSMVMVPFGVTVSVPYPVYNILRRSKYKELEQIKTMGKDGVLKPRNVFHERSRFNLQDLGDDNKTVGLPVSQKEQFRQISVMTDNLMKLDRRKLIIMARRLRVRIPKALEPGDEGTQQIRDAIRAKLGFDVLMDFAA